MFVKNLTAKELATRDFKNWEVPSEKILRRAFDLFDINGDGVVDFGEIRKSMYKYFGLKLTEEETRSMLILYDTDSSGSLCYEEFKIMIENLESLDPASVGRFWIRQFGWFPPFKYFARKLGLNRVKRRKLLQNIEETQRLLDKSKAVLNLDYSENSTQNTRSDPVRKRKEMRRNQRFSLDDDILHKRLLENKRRSSVNRSVGVRKHRGRIRSLPANYIPTIQKPSRRELKSLNAYIPKLDPSGPTASRIKDYAEKLSKFQRVANFRKSNDGEKEKIKQEYNPKPRHWPPHSYQKVVTYVKNDDCKFSTNNTTAKEKLVATESRTLKKNIYPNNKKRQRERRKSVKRELNFAIKNAQRQNMQHQIFVDADYVRGKENTNTLEGIVQPKKKRGGALRNSQRNGKRRVSFSSSVYVHTIPRNK